MTEQHPGLDSWFAAGRTGMSAKAIVAHLAGRGDQDGSYPRDAADFARCERLFLQVPSLRASLHQMAEVNDYWAALVPRWDEIAESEDRTALIKEILSPIHDADPNYAELREGVAIRVGNAVRQADVTGAQLKEAVRKARKAPPMKHDHDFEQAQEATYRVTADELRSFIERFERLEAEKKDIADQQKEVMAEAEGRGYDTKVMKKLVALRKREPSDVAEEEAVLDLYKVALGMA